MTALAFPTLNVTGDNGEGYGNFMSTCSGATDNAGNTAQPVSDSYTVQGPPNDTSSVKITSNGLFYNKIKKQGTETITVTNTSGSAIAGPLQLVLTISGAASAVGPTGTWGGNPYCTLTGSSLAPGASVSLTLTFSYAAGTNFTTTAAAYSATLRN
jgi:hypothetical protein